MTRDKDRDYLTVADVLAMYTVLMERYGGESGIRDPGALESAIFRPMTGYYTDTISEAAALMESLAINHPFIGGCPNFCVNGISVNSGRADPRIQC